MFKSFDFVQFKQITAKLESQQDLNINMIGWTFSDRLNNCLFCAPSMLDVRLPFRAWFMQFSFPYAGLYALAIVACHQNWSLEATISPHKRDREQMEAARIEVEGEHRSSFNHTEWTASEHHHDIHYFDFYIQYLVFNTVNTISFSRW